MLGIKPRLDTCKTRALPYVLFLQPQNPHLLIQEVSLHPLDPQDFSLDSNPMFQLIPLTSVLPPTYLSICWHPTNTICRTRDVLGLSALNISPDSKWGNFGDMKCQFCSRVCLPFLPIHTTDLLCLRLLRIDCIYLLLRRGKMIVNLMDTVVVDKNTVWKSYNISHCLTTFSSHCLKNCISLKMHWFLCFILFYNYWLKWISRTFPIYT